MKKSALPRQYSLGRVRNLYEDLAWHYDFCCWMTESKSQQRTVDLAIRDKSETVLDVAVGTGYIIEATADKVKDGLVVAVDVSEHMMSKAKKKVSERDNVLLQYACAYNLPFRSATFDVVLNTYMLGLMPEEDIPVILKEFNRVLKPGGRVGVAALAQPRHWYNRGWTVVAKYFPDVLGDCRPVNLDDPLRSAGFKVLNHEFVSQSTYPSELFIAEKLAGE